MPEISVIICCANAEDTLGPACESAKWADELIVVDSGSQDRTPQIAQQHADRYVVEPWRGYMGQKKFASELARNDWVFVLDGDEEISPELAREVASLTAQQLDSHDVFLLRRRNYLMGRFVRAWCPDWQSRLIHQKRCSWPDEVLHEARQASSPDRCGRLKGHIEHKRVSDAGFSDYFSGERMDERLLMVAQQMHDRGKRATGLDLVLRPWFAFFKFYFLKKGFLDGAFGLLIAQKAAVSTQLKYAALWYVQHNKRQDPK